MRKELSQGSEVSQDDEEPIIRSLFDVKGNSKFKGDSKSDDAVSSSNSEEEEEEKKIPIFNSKPTTNFTFPAKVVPKFGVSAVFATGASLWTNPFAQKKHETKSEDDKEKPTEDK